MFGANEDYEVHLPENQGGGFDDDAQVQHHFAKQYAKAKQIIDSNRT